MKKYPIAVAAFLVVSAVAMICVLKPRGTVFEETAKGFKGDVTVRVTMADGKIADVKVVKNQETPAVAGAALSELPREIVAQQSAEVDIVSGATFTSNAIKNAVAAALKKAGFKDKGSAKWENKAVTFVPGTYKAKAKGYAGPVEIEVTFSDKVITDIKLLSTKDTPHVGTPAIPILFADAKEATGSGIDIVSGATFTSAAVKQALTDAAIKAEVSDLAAFKKNRVVHKPQAAINETYDVVVIGGGGAGIAAAAQATQNGDSVIVIEKNVEIGGNTVVSGGQFQSAMPYLCWDENDPDATEGVYPFDKKSYKKVKMANGNITVLKEILNWDEKPFDPKGAKDWFEAGDIERLSKHGVHQEYLPVLKALKEEIKKYMAWAQPKLDSGIDEGELTLFSTVNLHIFQTYYGGLRPNADFTKWIYGDYDLVCQFIKDGQDLKPWLESQGARFIEDIQPTIVGALWNRENDFVKYPFDADGDGEMDTAQWGAYFAPTRKTVLSNPANKIMVRTDAKELIVEGGKVTGVKAVMFDGTEVTLKAKKGVVISTGGAAANIPLVRKENKYWVESAITEKTQTTNRSSLVGDGLKMGEKVGAVTTGMDFTQLMPISWIDNGQLAFGGGNYAIYLNPKTGKRFVNETGERDVLSLGEFKNGMEMNGVMGVVIEIANSAQAIPGPYPYGTPKTPETWEADVEGRQYTRTVDELGDLFKTLGIPCDAAKVKEEIIAYDKALMTGTENTLDVPKTGWSRLIGNCDRDSKGHFIPETYKLEGVKLKIRLLAPSTHHTMGGLKTDIDRRVLDKSGKAIKGLYAAGEVTGGIHGGNRLGGNAIVEIFVSGRTAANAIKNDN